MNRRVIEVLEAVVSGRLDRVTKANAAWLLAEARAHRARKLKRTLGRRKDGKSSAAARAQRVAEIRDVVFGRCGARCECCASRAPSELHHLLSGPSRRAKESPETCVAVCAYCHVDLHRGRVEALLRLRKWAMGLNLTEALNALERRLDKIEEARAATPSLNP